MIFQTQNIGGGIAKRFRQVVAPEASGTVVLERVFSPLGGPPEFTARMCIPFLFYQLLPGGAFGITQPAPREMKQLMQEDAVQLREVTKQLLFQHHLAAKQETGGVYRGSTLAVQAAAEGEQRRSDLQRNGGAGERRQTAGDPADGSSQRYWRCLTWLK